MGNKLTSKIKFKRKQTKKSLTGKGDRRGDMDQNNERRNCNGSVTECPSINRVLNGLIKYQRQLYEGKQLITPNTNPIFGYFVRLIKRANAFWYRIGKAPATNGDI